MDAGPRYRARVANRWPFVGRKVELDRAAYLIGQGQGMLLLGPAGIGKSTMARTVARSVRDESTRVVRVTGHAVSSRTPYSALAGAVDGIAPTSASAELSPTQVAAAVASSTDFPSSDRLLLVVDDLHLVDVHSTLALFHLAADHRAVVVATAQDGATLDGAARLWTEGHVDRLELSGLDVEEVAEFLERGLDGPVDISTVRAFAHRSEGNPLMLRELAAAALDSGHLVYRQSWTLMGEPVVSSGIRHLVQARLAGLEPSQRAALERIAATEPVALSMILTMTEHETLEDLESDHLVAIRTGLGAPEVTTAHPLFGEVLREELPNLRLRRYRLEMAKRLESGVEPRPAELVRAALWRLESGETPDLHALQEAAAAARVFSLDTAERLARGVVEGGGPVAATLLLAEILTHTGRSDRAAALIAQLPPESLDSADREALVYCAAVGQGLAAGDAEHGVDLVEPIIAGDPDASVQLRALHVSLLAFDARIDEALALGRSLVDDEQVPPPARALAGVGVVGAEYWLGCSAQAVAHADALMMAARQARESLPYAEPSLQLIAICALLDQGNPGDAEQRAQGMRRQALADNDPFAIPRAEYCLGRVAQYRGMSATAIRRFRRCVASVGPFDQFIRRHLLGTLARAEATAGHVDRAVDALAAGADGVRMKVYEPEWDLAEAAVLAAQLRLGEAVDRAAWAASVAADRHQWNVALMGYHDAARYGGARSVLSMLESVPTVDGEFGACLVEHVAALAAGDATGLDGVSIHLGELGAVPLAAEACAEAGIIHSRSGSARAAAASLNREAWLWDRCEDPVSPWLVGAASVAPLTDRERQVALLAGHGHSDRVIARTLGISVRTVQTHLTRCYAKLGIRSRRELSGALRTDGTTTVR
ncbi:MAG: LuxR C-terminal-related transcriptional regulator [Nocardioides sp.]